MIALSSSGYLLKYVFFILSDKYIKLPVIRTNMHLLSLDKAIRKIRVILR